MSRKKEKVAGPFASLKDLRDKLAAEEPARKALSPQAPTKAKTSAKSSERGLDDHLSFARLMRDVVPLSETTTRLTKSLDEPVRVDRDKVRTDLLDQEAKEQEAVFEHLRTLAMGQVRFEVTDDGSRVEGRRIDVLPALVRKLRHGQFPIDGRCDLHGQRASDAQQTVTEFLAKMRARGERCVLIIHGKGLSSPHGDGVLRGEMSAWLSQGRAAEHVAAFASSTQADGGDGAIYVLLRR